MVAIVKSEVLHLPDADVRTLLLPHPVAAAALARRLAGRVREAIAQRSLLALANPLHRLAAQLLTLAGDGDEIAHAPTHQEIAIMINTTRETVSRGFQTLLTQGLIARDGNRLKLLRADALRSILAGGDSENPCPQNRG